MKKIITTGLLSFCLLVYGCQKTAEHPEGIEKQEHPQEHPEEKKESKITIEDVAKAAERYVINRYEDGYFIYRDSNGKLLKLKLDKVHRERLSPLGDNTYFVCADFVAEDGTKYDLDFFMKGSSPENLNVYDMTIHKINGKPLYTWIKVGEIWKRKYD